MISTENLFDEYPQFYGNPVIGQLADSPRWTISDNGKVPIDMRELQATGRIRGAYEKSISCLMTLEELTEFMPRAANHAFALNASIDEVLVLDIEKDCPPSIAEELLRLPALYSELSMSGFGYHLIMPLPDNFDDFPIAAGKLKLQEEHKWYEVLIEHWVTFTRKPVPTSLTRGAEPASLEQWDQLYARLASRAVETQTAKVDVELDKPEIPGEHQAIFIMTQQAPPRTLEDFHFDHSRYEFSVLSALNRRLNPALPFLSGKFDIEYTPSMRVWLIYEAARQIIPHRTKHDELRNNMPLLLNAATDLIARQEAQRLDRAGANAS
ncbi:hypothetical protein [Arthrobacter bambusae]|uniref:DNA primase n=1 Tax=Arthrobacter bambusae TaxID=1338426 RepID=A0AAW8DCM8_9MICC|nr:hypothetical protein [Arthrobacter bambusae]MDP9903181.1 hypothetical protein [Arthrobacter bambusae]MDQ0128825.1 hypothetical protein [Arthrobacter bambusae]MDQ0180166.1 hypothetical protein [Arthrobacter bambusae]